MHTDKKNKEFSRNVYNVNNKKVEKRIDVGDEIEGYTVLAVENNKDNGMQAMAVAPVERNGEVGII